MNVLSESRVVINDRSHRAAIRAAMMTRVPISTSIHGCAMFPDEKGGVDGAVDGGGLRILPSSFLLSMVRSLQRSDELFTWLTTDDSRVARLHHMTYDHPAYTIIRESPSQPFAQTERCSQATSPLSLVRMQRV